MDDKRFWTIVESGGRKALANQKLQLAAIRKELRKLSPADIIAFDQAFTKKRNAAYTWDLWGAAYLINGGCSDDGFHYFRAWLISRGRAAYEAAVKNPDSLAGITDSECDEYEFEELGYLPMEVYEESTREAMPPPKVKLPRTPKGKRWDFDDDEAVARKFPKLAKVYLS